MNFFKIMPFNGLNDVSEGQLRWQVFTSLAYGSKGKGTNTLARPHAPHSLRVRTHTHTHKHPTPLPPPVSMMYVACASYISLQHASAPT